MLQRNKNGFFLLELLLSLSAWLLLSLFILPLLIDLNKQTQQLEVKEKAEQLLFEELQAKIADGQSYPKNYSVLNRGIEYKIEWKNPSTEGPKEVCVKVETQLFISKAEICAKPE